MSPFATAIVLASVIAVASALTLALRLWSTRCFLDRGRRPQPEGALRLVVLAYTPLLVAWSAGLLFSLNAAGYSGWLAVCLAGIGTWFVSLEARALYHLEIKLRAVALERRELRAFRRAVDNVVIPVVPS
jgi:hypothetical protein